MNDSGDYEESMHAHIVPVSGLYKNWFLDYASYVILERAVPAIEDGLKPVQRRILHAMYEMDDGRFNKVANIIGQSMQYHPHGDASIGDAIVNMGQKDLLIETQGNWGDVNTGDTAAAARYIEARLSKFALDVVFNPDVTRWQNSYDGRKKEPITLPVKFPLLLAQGVEGIAVGLSTRVLPHNFIEIIKSAIDILKGRKARLYPDFSTGGYIDITHYNDGKRGGKIRVRAKIDEIDKKTLVIKEIPFGTTTQGIIDSIVKANDTGKIKVKKIIDNTANSVDIVLQLAPGVSPDITIDALYAFTDCEISISTHACVIAEEKPLFTSATDLLEQSVSDTLDFLEFELELKLEELSQGWHKSSLEKIFIENKIYRHIENCETWESVISTIDKGLQTHAKLLRREITQDDIVLLTEIKIKRISKFDSIKADEYIKSLEKEMEIVSYNLSHLNQYAIQYYESILKKHGKGRERKTEIRTFDNIRANIVAIANQKLYLNRQEGFIGTALKKDEYICDCSEYDDIIVFRKNGSFTVSKVADKTFVGKEIIHADVFRKNDERMVYNLIYQDGKENISMVKRFNISGITRDKEYDLTKGNAGSKVLYFSANPNGEAEIVSVFLSPHSKAKQKEFEYDFSMLSIKSRNAQGNILSRHLVKSIKFKQKGFTTLSGIKIWYDSNVGRLNKDGYGTFLGVFESQDNVLVLYKDGSYELTSFELSNRYDISLIFSVEKYIPSKIITAIYKDGEKGNYYVKRFILETQTINKKFTFISENEGSTLILVSTLKHPFIRLSHGKKKLDAVKEEMDLAHFVEIKGWKSNGKKLVTGDDYVAITLLEPHPDLEIDKNSEQNDVRIEIESDPPNPSKNTRLKDFVEFKPDERKKEKVKPGKQPSLF